MVYAESMNKRSAADPLSILSELKGFICTLLNPKLTTYAVIEVVVLIYQILKRKS